MLENHGCSEKIADHYGSNTSAWANDGYEKDLAPFWINDHRSRKRGELVYIFVLDISIAAPALVFSQRQTV
jgi:hypothetical protein